MLGNGPVYTIKVGRTTMDIKELVKNVIRGAYGLMAHVFDGKIGPEHVRQVSVKTFNSPSLPVYNGLSAGELAAYKNAKE